MGMHRWVVAGLFALGITIGVGIAPYLYAQNAALQSRELIRTDLKNIPGQEALIFTSVWQPGFRLPLHIHPEGHEFMYILEGELSFETKGLSTRTLKAGELVYTEPNVPHYGRNASDNITKTIVIRIKDKSQPIAVEVK